MHRRPPSPFLVLPLLALALGACSRDDTPSVTVYCALDRNFSEPVLREFERRTGIRVDAQFDVEKSKTVGLVRAIEEERDRPRCDVFWNNEILHTIRLGRQGLLDAYRPADVDGIPAGFRDPEDRWHGFAARARVYIVNTERLPDPAAWPRTHADLADPRFRSQGAMAKPLTGTTQTHAAVLAWLEGPEAALQYFRDLVANDVALAGSNAQVMRMVRDGERAFGWIDTDDYNVAKTSTAPAYPVDVVYPDSEPGGIGTIVIPNTVAIVKGGPHPDAARKLIDFLLTAEVEERLARSGSAQIPLRSGVPTPPEVVGLDELRPMAIDWEGVVDAFEGITASLQEELVR